MSEIAQGETATFTLSYGPSHLPPPAAVDPKAALSATQAYWNEWLEGRHPQGAWSKAVTRSLITVRFCNVTLSSLRI